MSSSRQLFRYFQFRQASFRPAPLGSEKKRLRLHGLKRCGARRSEQFRGRRATPLSTRADARAAMDLSLHRRRQRAAPCIARAAAWGSKVPPERGRLLSKPGLWSKACRTEYLPSYPVENWTLVLAVHTASTSICRAIRRWNRWTQIEDRRPAIEAQARC